MPRRSSSQSHRLVELFREAEKGQATTSPVAVKPTPEPSPPPSQQSSEDEPFDYEKWRLQCLATTLAVPSGSLRSPQGKKHAEAIFNYLSSQEYDKIGPHRGQGIQNRCPSPAERRSYDRRLYLRTLIA